MLWEKHVDLLLIGEEGKRDYVLIKDFNTFRYDHSLHCGRKHFCPYAFHVFITDKYWNFILKTTLKLMANEEL